MTFTPPPPYPFQWNIPGTHLCSRLSRPQGHSASSTIMSMKNSNDTIGNRTCYLPVCSAVPQPNSGFTRYFSSGYHNLNYLLTPWSSVLLEKLTVFQLVKSFPAFYRTRKFITAYTSARHLSLSWASYTQSIPPHRTSWGFILILSSHSRLGIT